MGGWRGGKGWGLDTPDCCRKEQNGVNGGTAADARHLNGRRFGVHSVSQDWGDFHFKIKEGAFRHSEHALKRVIFNVSKLLYYSTAQSLDVAFPAYNAAADTVTSMQLLCALAYALHA